MPSILQRVLAVAACFLLAGCFRSETQVLPQGGDDLGIGPWRVGKIGTGTEQKPFQVTLVKGVYVITGPEMDEPNLSSVHRIGPTAFLVQSWTPASQQHLYNILDASGAPSYQLIQLDCQDFEAGVLAEYRFDNSLGFCSVTDATKLLDFAKGVVEGRAKPVKAMRRILMVLEEWG